MLEAGYNVTPPEFVTKMESIDGFSPDGEVINLKVTEAYPFFHYAPGNFAIIKGDWKVGNSVYQHFVAKMANGQVINPWGATGGFPIGYTITSQQTVSIDQPPVPATPPATNEQYMTFDLLRKDGDVTVYYRTFPITSAGLAITDSILIPIDTEAQLFQAFGPDAFSRVKVVSDFSGQGVTLQEVINGAK